MAGPNGSGKSTVLRQVSDSFYCGSFVNADEIEKQLRVSGFFAPKAAFNLIYTDAAFDRFMGVKGKSWLEKSKNSGASIGLFSKDGILYTKGSPTPYDGAVAADFLRHMLLKKGETFTIETVLSHASKVKFLKDARKKGFKNYLYFISTANPNINIIRVRNRAKLGGHNVDEGKIISRYYQSLELLKDVIPLCHRVYFYDNSATTKKPTLQWIAEIDDKGSFSYKDNNRYTWLEEYVIDPIYGRN